MDKATLGIALVVAVALTLVYVAGAKTPSTVDIAASFAILFVIAWGVTAVFRWAKRRFGRPARV